MLLEILLFLKKTTTSIWVCTVFQKRLFHYFQFIFASHLIPHVRVCELAQRLNLCKHTANIFALTNFFLFVCLFIGRMCCYLNPQPHIIL